MLAMVHRKRRGDRDPVRPPLTLEQMLLGATVLVTSAASRTQELRVALLSGSPRADEIIAALKSLQMARESLEIIIPMMRKRLREVRSVELQAKR